MNTQVKPEPVMDWPAILAELHRRGMTLTELARRHGFSGNSCRKVRSQTNYKAQQAIADFIGHKPEDLWPSRYPRVRTRILDTVKYPPVASQKAGAVADSRSAA